LRDRGVGKARGASATASSFEGRERGAEGAVRREGGRIDKQRRKTRSPR